MLLLTQACGFIADKWLLAFFLYRFHDSDKDPIVRKYNITDFFVV